MLRNENLPGNVLPFDNDQLPIDILLLAVKDCEFLACLSYLNEGFRKMYRKDLGAVYLGDMGEDEPKLRIAVMKTQEGGGVPGGCAVVVINAVNVLMPKAVFCVGSCGGLNFNKVKLGDVAISMKLITYAPSKVTVKGIEEQGVKVPLKPLLLKLMLNADEGWKAPLKDPKDLEVQVHRGAFLSGPEVIDSDERRNALMTRFPEAVAVEMEGEGKSDKNLVFRYLGQYVQCGATGSYLVLLGIASKAIDYLTHSQKSRLMVLFLSPRLFLKGHCH